METGRHVRCDVAVTTVEPLLASLSHKSGHPSSLMTLIKPPQGRHFDLSSKGGTNNSDGCILFDYLRSGVLLLRKQAIKK